MTEKLPHNRLELTLPKVVYIAFHSIIEVFTCWKLLLGFTLVRCIAFIVIQGNQTIVHIHQ